MVTDLLPGDLSGRSGRSLLLGALVVFRSGGVGKTAVAVEAARIEVSDGRAELACYIDLVPCRTEDQVVAALVEGVGIRGPRPRRDLMLLSMRCRAAGLCW